jgi:hypothetical protein
MEGEEDEKILEAEKKTTLSFISLFMQKTRQEISSSS